MMSHLRRTAYLAFDSYCFRILQRGYFSKETKFTNNFLAMNFGKKKTLGQFHYFDSFVIILYVQRRAKEWHEREEL